VLGFEPPGAPTLAAIGALVAAYLVCAEALKRRALGSGTERWGSPPRDPTPRT
jgi:hypothetical protein